MERTNFYDAIYSPVVLLLNAVVVGIVMLLSASGNARILSLFGMSVGTSVAVINYISRIFAPIESLGMEIQTIQSAMAGVRRIDAFLCPARARHGERRNCRMRRCRAVARHLRLRRSARPARFFHDRQAGRANHARRQGPVRAKHAARFKLLLGQAPPQAGTVTIGGVDASAISTGRALRRQILPCCFSTGSRQI